MVRNHKTCLMAKGYMTFEFKPYSLLSASIHLLESTAKDYELGIQSKHVFPSLWSVLVMISLTPSAQF